MPIIILTGKSASKSEGPLPRCSQEAIWYRTTRLHRGRYRRAAVSMPKKDDWVFAPYNYKVSCATPPYKPPGPGTVCVQGRHCEVVINGVYKGVYVLLEKVKR
jgi:hypothetical protein